MGRGVSDEAVKRATGKVWSEWFSILDKMGARKMEHKEIAEKLFEAYKPGLSGWWSQMVTVGYEQARGKRAKGQRASGKYSLSKSATVAAPAKEAFKAWEDDASRARLLKGVKLAPRSADPPKAIRFNVPDDGSWIEVRFTPKGPSKCAVVVQHEDVPDAATSEKRKALWAETLERMKRLLEG
jgi:uncharacterized protein YndB with AHSA1/START domain